MPWADHGSGEREEEVLTAFRIMCIYFECHEHISFVMCTHVVECFSFELPCSAATSQPASSFGPALHLVLQKVRLVEDLVTDVEPWIREAPCARVSREVWRLES
jgi:hypothetical protein